MLCDDVIRQFAYNVQFWSIYTSSQIEPFCFVMQVLVKLQDYTMVCLGEREEGEGERRERGEGRGERGEGRGERGEGRGERGEGRGERGEGRGERGEGRGVRSER